MDNIIVALVLQETISKLEDSDTVGMITCVRSDARKDRPQCPDIRLGDAELQQHVREHVRVANQLYKKYGITLRDVQTKKIGGFFMLVNKNVWRKIRFRSMKKGVAFIDWDFTDRLLKNGYRVYVLPGLYVFHGRREKV